jgi:hypothetical protein
MDNRSDMRKFDRFPLEFVLEVLAKDNEGIRFKDKAVLKDISGGGAKFITQHTGKYFLGQSLEISIYLPGASYVRAHMKGKAMVVRIDPLNDLDIDHKSRGVGVAIKLNTPLYLERINMT